MRVLLTGSTGLIGSALHRALIAEGMEVFSLVRRAVSNEANQVFWDPYSRTVEPSRLEHANALIHLSGENVALGRWTPERKRNIYDSRIKTTSFLGEVLTALKNPPRVWLCASAVGYYGDRGDAAVDESHPMGSGFLAQVCSDWESATRPAIDRGIRVIHLRFGMVLSREGGAMARLLPVFRLGLGGVLGNGKQYMSWVTLDDAVRAMCFLLSHEEVSGAVNVVAPEPVTNREFTKSLAQALHRPAVLPVPALALRMIFGEMADAVLLSSIRALPRKLERAGFAFRSPTLPQAWSALL